MRSWTHPSTDVKAVSQFLGSLFSIGLISRPLGGDGGCLFCTGCGSGGGCCWLLEGDSGDDGGDDGGLLLTGGGGVGVSLSNGGGVGGWCLC